MKKIVILKPNCHELTNHLWNYVSIYAYGIETGARVQNPSFFEWYRYFNLVKEEPFATKMVSHFPALKGLWRGVLALCASYLIRARQSCVMLTLSFMTYLPPTRKLTAHSNVCDTTYFIGWLFRNPLGLERYRDMLITAFMPKENILNTIEATLAPFSGKRLIGIHLRQKPYKGFEDENFIVPPARVRTIVDEYLREKKLSMKDVALVIVSDEDVHPSVFEGFTTYRSRDNAVNDLFVLSKCSVVIGTNSTFSNLAAWFGNIPHIVESNGPMDWEYYRDATTYFDNKYATFAF